MKIYFYRMQIYFYQMKIIFIEFCYISATIARGGGGGV